MKTRLLVRRFRGAGLYLGAVATAAAIAATAVRVLAHVYGIGLLPAVLLAVAQNAPLVLAIRFPLPAWCLMTAADLAAAPVLLHAPHLAGHSWPWPVTVPIGQAVVLLAVARRGRTEMLVAVWTTLAVSGYVLARVSPGNSDGADTLLAVVSAVVLAGEWTVRERAAAQRQLVAQQLAGQTERARIALLEERTRIARELHDVVAHHMSVIAVQADSAPYRIEALTPEAADEFASVASTARSALTEMRRLLGVLRDERDVERQLAPRPGLDRLPELVSIAARAGIPVDLYADDRALAHARRHPAADLAAFRLVQEGLANVVRHAPGAAARVEVSVERERLRVCVVNDAPPGGPPGPGGPVERDNGESGQGLVGMGERIRLVGGVLEAGLLPGGGFRLDARIPLNGDGGGA